MLMCPCLNIPISLLHFSFTPLEDDSISKYYEKSHTHTKLHSYYFKMQTPVAHINPVQLCHPPVAEPAVIESATAPS